MDQSDQTENLVWMEGRDCLEIPGLLETRVRPAPLAAKDYPECQGGMEWMVSPVVKVYPDFLAQQEMMVSTVFLGGRGNRETKDHQDQKVFQDCRDL